MADTKFIVKWHSETSRPFHEGKIHIKEMYKDYNCGELLLDAEEFDSLLSDMIIFRNTNREKFDQSNVFDWKKVVK